MENKNMKYGLIGGTIIVWGLIVYRVSAGLSSPDLPPAAVSKPRIAAPVQHNDSFVLYADYPDPFIPEKDSVVLSSPPSAPPPTAVATAPVAAPAGPKPPTTFETLKSELQYVGMVGNPAKKLKVAIINLHGQDQLVREKDKLGGFTIKKIERDRIGVMFKGGYFEVLREEK